MTITLTELRANLYKVVDEVIETGIPVEIQRGTHKIKIVLADGPSKLDRLIQRPDAINGDLEDLVHHDWSHEWSEDKKH